MSHLRCVFARTVFEEISKRLLVELLFLRNHNTSIYALKNDAERSQKLFQNLDRALLYFWSFGHHNFGILDVSKQGVG